MPQSFLDYLFGGSSALPTSTPNPVGGTPQLPTSAEYGPPTYAQLGIAGGTPQLDVPTPKSPFEGLGTPGAWQSLAPQTPAAGDTPSSGQGAYGQAQTALQARNVPTGPAGASTTNWSNVPTTAGIPAEYQTYVQQAANQSGLDPNLIAAVIQQESRWNPTAVSPAGAQGLMQLMPATARALGVTDANDPSQNITAGARYLAQHMQTHQGNLPLALAAYNAGPGAVQEYGGVPPFPETQTYVRNVQNYYDQYRQPVGQAPAAALQPGAVAQHILAEAQNWVGSPYVWGGQSREGADCSGFILGAAAAAGAPFPPGVRTAEQIRQVSQPLTGAQVQPGDLVFFQGTDGATPPGQASHVGIVTESGIMLNAKEPGQALGPSALTTPWAQQHLLGYARPPQYAR
jgi:cell wall-associated NlpC family hydrolase